MTPVTAVEKNQEELYQSMKKYVEDFKALPPKKAKAVAKKSLIRSGIIDKNGRLTDRYRNSRNHND